MKRRWAPATSKNSEEPVIEHAPDDETPTPPPARETARDRRRGRLHFVEPETEATENVETAALPPKSRPNHVKARRPQSPPPWSWA